MEVQPIFCDLPREDRQPELVISLEGVPYSQLVTDIPAAGDYSAETLQHISVTYYLGPRDQPLFAVLVSKFTQSNYLFAHHEGGNAITVKTRP